MKSRSSVVLVLLPFCFGFACGSDSESGTEDGAVDGATDGATDAATAGTAGGDDSGTGPTGGLDTGGEASSTDQGGDDTGDDAADDTSAGTVMPTPAYAYYCGNKSGLIRAELETGAKELITDSECQRVSASPAGGWLAWSEGDVVWVQGRDSEAEGEALTLGNETITHLDVGEDGRAWVVTGNQDVWEHQQGVAGWVEIYDQQRPTIDIAVGDVGQWFLSQQNLPTGRRQELFQSFELIPTGLFVGEPMLSFPDQRRYYLDSDGPDVYLFARADNEADWVIQRFDVIVDDLGRDSFTLTDIASTQEAGEIRVQATSQYFYWTNGDRELWRVDARGRNPTLVFDASSEELWVDPLESFSVTDAIE